MRYSRTLLVTGATGSIGSEVVRLALADGWRVIAMARNDSRLHELRELLGLPYGLELLQGDVAAERHRARRQVHAIVHCAAVKHVWAGEADPVRAAEINIRGTERMASEASRVGVPMVHVSTDKAVQPVNCYGASKMMAERVALNHGATVLRLCNVLDSSGSVLPMAEHQAQQLGEVLLTDERMRRRFITAEDAARLALQLTNGEQAGRVCIPTLEHIQEERIKHRLQAIADRHGVPVRVIGARPGERLSEPMMWPGEDVAQLDLQSVEAMA